VTCHVEEFKNKQTKKKTQNKTPNFASSTKRNTHMNFCKCYSANAILNRLTSMNSNLTFITILNNATKEFLRFM